MATPPPLRSELHIPGRYIALGASALVAFGVAVGVGVRSLLSHTEDAAVAALAEKMGYEQGVAETRAICADVQQRLTNLEAEIVSCGFHDDMDALEEELWKQDERLRAIADPLNGISNVVDAIAECDPTLSHSRTSSAALVAELRYAIHEGRNNPALLARYDAWLGQGMRGISPGTRHGYKEPPRSSPASLPIARSRPVQRSPVSESPLTGTASADAVDVAMGGSPEEPAIATPPDNVGSIFQDAVTSISCRAIDEGVRYFVLQHPSLLHRNRLRVYNPGCTPSTESPSCGSDSLWIGKALWSVAVGNSTPPPDFVAFAATCYAAQPKWAYVDLNTDPKRKE